MSIKSGDKSFSIFSVFNVWQRVCVMESCDFYVRGISNGNSEVRKNATNFGKALI
ncbi:hypothetical protein MC378_15070 [Polaribacter sp. MSW13]|uniref:Uncharacterized protein n=1 Tax=Polaribacter marinus TaxID=2916838 RepID=A0A9X1VQN1_9FLAO|nr:hypothetical protein [Polaribacter marinus]MCI2230495.1 hypothetical protein [Polaribacter marinus]